MVDESAVSLGGLFRAVRASCDRAGADHEALPTALARACVDVLGVAGASLSFTSDLRIPLGASDRITAEAEQLQITCGEGPCLTATAQRTPIHFPYAVLQDRWPVFSGELIARTPFRSITSLPLVAPHNILFGAIDLYHHSPTQLPSAIAEVQTAVADLVAWALIDDLATDTSPFERWTGNQQAEQRLNVWVAVGMLIEHTFESSADALAALQAYAYTHDQTLDDLAEALTSRRLTPSALTT